jgi:predicted nucleotide-binding protein
LDQINEAVNQTSGGVFLFTRDDMLMGAEELAVPRDNVVFEAGIFANSKGYERVLIFLEDGAKLPADLGGIVYVPIADKRSIANIEDQMMRFINNVL